MDGLPRALDEDVCRWLAPCTSTSHDAVMAQVQMTWPLTILCLSLLYCAHAAGDVEVDIANGPKVPDFRRFFPAVPNLGRRLQIACPCVGIHAAGHAVNALGVPCDTNNIYDLESSYHDALMHHLLAAGMEPKQIVLNLGKVSGDLLATSLKDLQLPVDFMITGPPCPPWAGQGNKNSLRDVRALVFLRILEWLWFFVKTGCLIGCILENVVGLLHQINGEESAGSKFVRVLREFLPEFDWAICTLDTLQYAFPHTHTRSGVPKRYA